MANSDRDIFKQDWAKGFDLNQCPACNRVVDRPDKKIVIFQGWTCHFCKSIFDQTNNLLSLGYALSYTFLHNKKEPYLVENA